VASIGFSSNSSVFLLSDLPPMPANIGPGESISFTITFAPNNLGVLTGTLRVDGQSFTLSGLGAAAAPIPAFSFEGAGGTAGPFQQPGVGLTLAEPYPLTLNGSLTLTTSSSQFPADPAVQFSSGGKTVNFTIPANTTRALFANSATQVRLQTGTIAADIVLTPAFSTEAGLNMTPTSPRALVLTVPQAAPAVLSAQATSITSNGFSLTIAGYASGRSVRKLNCQFHSSNGVTLASNQVSIDVTSAFDAWYLSSQSTAFGSLFTATVPFSLQSSSATQNPIAAIDSIDLVLTNDQGSSQPATVSLH
jgi:hypothetical protein